MKQHFQNVKSTEQKFFARFFTTPKQANVKFFVDDEKNKHEATEKTVNLLTPKQVFIRFFATQSVAQSIIVDTESPAKKGQAEPSKALKPPSNKPISVAKKTSEVKASLEATTSPERVSFYARLRQGLSRSRQGFGEQFAQMLTGKQILDSELLEDLEAKLLVADVGVAATQQLLDRLNALDVKQQSTHQDSILNLLKAEMLQLLSPLSKNPLEQEPLPNKPLIILVVGVNGVGKTTTIGKLAYRFREQGQKVMLAAGDTFRAAAVEQLQIWGQRLQLPVIAQKMGADSASVIYDAMQAAKSRNIDILIADTAGRLHNKGHLLAELEKVKRVMAKLDAAAPHEVMMVMDATTGQNGLAQAREFHQALGVTGITLTKLDGTAKGGIVFAVNQQLKLPIRYLGIGEQKEDLRPFIAQEFVAALFDQANK